MKFNELLKIEHAIDFFQLYLFSLDASRKYKTYSIKKRNGGLRTINHPSRELKKYQRILSKLIFSKLPTHKAVFSYKKGISIKDLAQEHKNNRFLLRIDFKDFFPSLTSKNIRELLEKNLDSFNFELSKDDITLINNIVCKSNKLTIGAPTSPIISNALLYDFDCEMNSFSKEITYSRYADDLYFSSNTPDLLQNIIPHIKNFLLNYKIKLQINENKNIYTSKKHKRCITGLVLTSENKISIGREKKKYLKSLIFKYIKNNITSEELTYLKGYLSFVQSVEESFLENLIKKYNLEIIKEIQELKYNSISE